MTATRTYAIGRQLTRTVNGHDITMVIGVDCFTITLWSGPYRHEDWSHTYTDFDQAVGECRRIRGLIETYSSIAAVEQRTEALTIQIQEQYRRLSHFPFRAHAEAALRILECEADQLRTTGDVAMLTRLRAELADSGVSVSVPSDPNPEEVEPGELLTAPARGTERRMSNFQSDVIAYALLAGDGTISRGRGQGRVSIRTLVALARRGYAALVVDGGRVVGARVTAAGACRATGA